MFELQNSRSCLFITIHNSHEQGVENCKQIFRNASITYFYGSTAFCKNFIEFTLLILIYYGLGYLFRLSCVDVVYDAICNYRFVKIVHKYLLWSN